MTDCACPVCGGPWRMDGIVVVEDRCLIVVGDRTASLTTKEMQLFLRLKEVSPRVLKQESLLTWIYQLNPDKEPEVKIIDVFICKLRKKLNHLGIVIETVWGNGYVLNWNAPAPAHKQVRETV